MRKLSVLAAIVLIACGSAAIGAGDAARKSAGEKRHEWGFTHHLKGTVTSIDAAAGSLAVKDDRGRIETFTIEPKAMVRTEAGKNVALRDVKVGDSVSVSYKSYKGKRDARKVEILRLQRQSQ